MIIRGVLDYCSEDINSIRGMCSDEAKSTLGGKMSCKDIACSENIVVMP